MVNKLLMCSFFVVIITLSCNNEPLQKVKVVNQSGFHVSKLEIKTDTGEILTFVDLKDNSILTTEAKIDVLNPINFSVTYPKDVIVSKSPSTNVRQTSFIFLIEKDGSVKTIGSLK